MYELARLVEERLCDPITTRRSVAMVIALLKSFSILGIGLPNPFRYISKKIFDRKIDNYKEVLSLYKSFDADKIRQDEEEKARKEANKALLPAPPLQEVSEPPPMTSPSPLPTILLSSSSSSSGAGSTRVPKVQAPEAPKRTKYFFEDDDDDGEDVMKGLAAESEKKREKARMDAIIKRSYVASIVDPRAGKKDTAPKFHVGTQEEIMRQLTRIILRWNYYDDECYREKLKSIPTSFENPKHYIEIFKPLLLKEVDAQIQQSKVEYEDFEPIEIIRHDVSNRGEYIICAFSFEDSERAHELRSMLSDNELVLIHPRKSDDLTTHMMGIIDKVLIRDKVIEGDISVKFYLPPKDKNSFAFRGELERNPRSWALKKVIDLNTSSREWSALMSSPEFFLANSLFSPFSNKVSDESLKRDKRNARSVLSTMLKSPAFAGSFNEAQIDSMLYAVSGEGFRLVQGPPGTGKTKTVLAILSALLAQVANPGKGFSSSTALENKRHILVCAPSNAAVDELALRILKNGLWDKDGNIYHPSVLRVGVSKSTDPDMAKISFDVSLERKMGKDKDWQKMKSSFDACNTSLENTRKQLDDINSQISELHPKFETARVSGDEALYKDLKNQMSALHDKKNSLKATIDKYHSFFSKRQSMQENMRRSLQTALITESTIVCCTLSAAGSDIMRSVKHGFETVLIDEAAQAVEVSTLIPLRYQVRRCIMVGDPAQLPATVISKAAANCSYEQSLFQRLKNSKHHYEMLNTQYRMHPSISKFSSDHFYENNLLPGPNVMSPSYTKPFHSTKIFAPFVYFDLKWTQEKKDQSKSTMNVQEAAFCKDLLNAFGKSYASVFKSLSVGIISPYSRQIKELNSAVSRAGCAYKNLEISSVDSFQGREKDIIIFSCVRAPVGKSIGFLADVRRMNVAITRAKYSLWIVGNSELLKTNSIWSDLINYAKDLNSCKINGNMILFYVYIIYCIDYDVPKDSKSFLTKEIGGLLKANSKTSTTLKVLPPPKSSIPSSSSLSAPQSSSPPITVSKESQKHNNKRLNEDKETKAEIDFKKPKILAKVSSDSSLSRSNSPSPSPGLSNSNGSGHPQKHHKHNHSHHHHHHH